LALRRCFETNSFEKCILIGIKGTPKKLAPLFVKEGNPPSEGRKHSIPSIGGNILLHVSGLSEQFRENDEL
jgi:hypothetical protein